eukprot:CAMPEP_0172301036 /NCGR_PEP_ID=MMETSP1058-20130122/3012_1 /TAXON_ID=83371 /ORGANISM="Detonula confervacea, Strain CCMP 353" /LENGTH=183 /DNA_ID=CAMNT_0013011025 /DNA_START=89 /DNA_END=640 /DNA_ORIENTATION=+
MTRFIVSCMLCLLLSVALPNSGSPNQFAHASSIRSLSSYSPPNNNNNDLPIIALMNTTNTTNVTSHAPTPVAAPTTAQPTKHYESPDEEKEEEEKKEGAKIGMIFLWIVVAFTVIWLVCYFRDALLFFFGNAWNNTRRYGCKGCLKSFCPCIFGYQSGAGSGGNEPLDQIIFETEDPNAPLMS